MRGAQLGDDREAVVARQHDVEHDEIEPRSARAEQSLERAFAGLDDLGVVPFGFEVEPQPFGEVQLVFDDEDALHVRLPAPSAAASVSVLPCPAPALSANARPP